MKFAQLELVKCRWQVF